MESTVWDRIRTVLEAVSSEAAKQTVAALDQLDNRNVSQVAVLEEVATFRSKLISEGMDAIKAINAEHVEKLLAAQRQSITAQQQEEWVARCKEKGMVQ